MQPNFQYFLAVAQEQNFTRAAEKLFISQPALTKYIKRLEDSLGVSLFERTSPIRLTYAGELYLKYAQSCIHQEKALLQSFEEIQQDKRGKIRLGISNFRGSILLPEVLPIFCSRYPKIEIELTERQSRELVNDLVNERIDFCISNPTDIIDYTELNYETLYQEKLYLSVSTNYPRLREFVSNPDEVLRANQAQQYPIFDIEQVQDERFFMLHPQQSMAYVVENFLSNRGIQLQNTLRTVNLTTSINLASTGMGFCFVPLPFRRNIFPSNMLYFRIAETDITWDQTVFYRKNDPLNSACLAFIDIMKELYSERG